LDLQSGGVLRLKDFEFQNEWGDPRAEQETMWIDRPPLATHTLVLLA